MSEELKESIELLMKHAVQDHGGSARCAMFLLSLWDGGKYKADLQDILYNDPGVFIAMLTILRFLYWENQQIDQFVTSEQIAPVIDAWGNRFDGKRAVL